MIVLVTANCIAALTVAIGSLYSAKKLHNVSLKYILRWPMNLFDTTPIGRILNRFSKDVDTLDNSLPYTLELWLFSFFEVSSRFFTFYSLFD